MTALTDEQLDRYARHIVLRDIGGAGQAKLRHAHVAVIGAGGIGCPAIQYLAAAGIGRLTVIDNDLVSLSNLQRQILFKTDDIGAAKVAIAGRAVAALNPDIDYHSINMRISGDNIAKLIPSADVIIDGSDNFVTRLTVSDYATAQHITLVSAAIGQFQGQIGTFRGWTDDAPCYRCFVGDAFDADDCDGCAEQGVLGAMAGMMGSWAAMEAIRAITGFGDSPTGKLHIFDGLEPAMRTIRIVKDPACSGCSDTR